MSRVGAQRMESLAPIGNYGGEASKFMSAPVRHVSPLCYSTSHMAFMPVVSLPASCYYHSDFANAKV